MRANSGAAPANSAQTRFHIGINNLKGPMISEEATVMANTSSSLRREREPRTARAMLKRACVLLALTACATLIVSMHAPAARLDGPDAFAIKDAQIVVSAGKTIAKGTVVFRKGLITDVGENVKIPGDARVIDGSGMT